VPPWAGTKNSRTLADNTNRSVISCTPLMQQGRLGLLGIGGAAVSLTTTHYACEDMTSLCFQLHE
jgi:hypothetical protein